MTRFRFAYLLAALILIAFVRPFIEASVLGVGVADVLLFGTLLAGAFAVAGKCWHLIVVAGLGVASALSQGLFLLTSNHVAARVFLLVTLAFYFVVGVLLLVAMFDGRRVTADTICQAMSVYLLLGLIGAMAYALLESVVPGSFSFPAGAAEPDRFDRFLGFSFVTLTTLGYGNISPASPRADALTTLQAAAGQIYLAIVVARLVGVQIGQTSADPLKDEPS
ncbi:MAG: ion channel [Planctomycetota bacterium]